MNGALLEWIDELERHGQLLRIREEVDPYLEIAAIHRQVHQKNGPSILYEKIKGTDFKAVSNLFGTMDRMEFLFRKTLTPLKVLMECWHYPLSILRYPQKLLTLSRTALRALPRHVNSGVPPTTPLKDIAAGMLPFWKEKIPVLECECRLQDLPQIHSRPLDGGSFITLPQVCSTPPANKVDIYKTNLGMYRVQISGNNYIPNREAGLHYQIHRGIGIHHTLALKSGTPLKVSIFIGGPPAHTIAALMPMPEGLSELTFAGILAAKPFRFTVIDGWVISADADFCILGTVGKETKPEGPFGDHLGHHSQKNPSPFITIQKVFHRKNAVWPFTVVGRPPQEDSMLGKFIHKLTENILPSQVKGIRELYPVNAAGVHNLLFVIGSEAHVPSNRRIPREILTQANGLLGFNQISLTKYLFICAAEDNPKLTASDVRSYIQHILERVDWRTDLHFQTTTTMDTLDYIDRNQHNGSKLVIAVAGKKRRDLCKRLPDKFILPKNYHNPKIILPGIIVVEAPAFNHNERLFNGRKDALNNFCYEMNVLNPGLFSQDGIAWIFLVDNSEFCSKYINNFLWVSFLHSDPSEDTFGIQSFYKSKRWGCAESLVTDARLKPYHNMPMQEDKIIEENAVLKLSKFG